MFDRPFETGRRDQVFGKLDGRVGATLARDVATATPLHVLGWWDNGIRHISNAVRPIRTPADCLGLRLRTLDNVQHQAAFRRLGFHPVFIDVADLPRAVAEGTLDAQENPLTNIVNFGLHAYHRHVSLTGHLVGVAPLLVNHARYAALPDDMREFVAGAAAASVAVQRQLAIAEEAFCRQLLGDAGVALLELAPIDERKFRAALQTRPIE
jgi:TRAP-type transport system periplasmic protein